MAGFLFHPAQVIRETAVLVSRTLARCPDRVGIGFYWWSTQGSNLLTTPAF